MSAPPQHPKQGRKSDPAEASREPRERAPSSAGVGVSASPDPGETPRSAAAASRAATRAAPPGPHDPHPESTALSSAIVIALLTFLLLLTPGVIEVNREAEFDVLLGDFHERLDRVLVAAHRGAHNRHPENSLGSIEEAIRLGVDIVELDVQLTRDGVFVLMHDEDVKRTTTGRGKISQLKLRDVKRLHLVGPDGRPTRERVPTLAEALQAAEDRILVDIDFKAGRDARRLVTTIERNNSLEEAFVFSPNNDLLAAIKKLNPNVQVMPRARTEEALDGVLSQIEAPIVHIVRRMNTRDVIEDIKRRSGRAWVNVLGEPDRAARRGDFSYWNRIVEGGANVLQTDQPELLLGFLRDNDWR